MGAWSPRSDKPTTIRSGRAVSTTSRKEAMGPRIFSAGKRRSPVRGIPHISSDQEPQLRMFGDVAADILQQRAAADQQKAVPAENLKRMGAKKHAPQEHDDERQQTAPQDHLYAGPSGPGPNS